MSALTDILLAPDVRPFAVAAGIMVVLGGIELLATLVGFSLSEIIGKDVAAETDTEITMLANLITFGSPYATTQPTLDAGDWYAESWNAHGGLVRYQAAVPGDELVIIGAKTVSCRTVNGTSTSSYICKWREF